jgi:hypothetical protein
MVNSGKLFDCETPHIDATVPGERIQRCYIDRNEILVRLPIVAGECEQELTRSRHTGFSDLRLPCQCTRCQS